jgi:hypothetical protein
VETTSEPTWADVTDVPAMPGAPLEWTSDGQRIVFLVVRAGSSAERSWDIHMIDADGKSPSQVIVEDVQYFDLG